MKRWPTWLVIKEMLRKPKWDVILHSVGWLLQKKKQKINFVKDVEKLKPSCLASGNIKWFNYYGKLWWFLKRLNIKLPCSPAIELLGIYSHALKAGTQTDICDMYANIDSSITHKSQEVETSKCLSRMNR